MWACGELVTRWEESPVSPHFALSRTSTLVVPAWVFLGARQSVSQWKKVWWCRNVLREVKNSTFFSSDLDREKGKRIYTTRPGRKFTKILWYALGFLSFCFVRACDPFLVVLLVVIPTYLVVLFGGLQRRGKFRGIRPANVHISWKVNSISEPAEN